MRMQLPTHLLRSLAAMIVVGVMVISPSPANAQLTELLKLGVKEFAIPVLVHIVGEYAKEGLDTFLDRRPSPPLGRVGPTPAEIAEAERLTKAELDNIKGRLAHAEARDSKNAALLATLRQQLDERITRKEAYELTMAALERVDRRVADLARRVHEHQRTLLAHDALLSELRTDVAYLKVSEVGVRRNLVEHGRRIRQAEEEILALRRDYPRWEPHEQGVYLGVKGMQLFRKEDYAESIRAFRAAHGFDPTEPGYLYGLALANQQSGRQEEAELVLARAVALERHRPLPQWYRVAIESVQGKQRNWLERSRHDPIYGVYVPATIRLPETLTNP